MNMLQTAIEQTNEDRARIEAAINKLINDFELNHKGAFVEDIENDGQVGDNDFKLRIKISL